jgi:hypothetical protein
MTDEEAEKLKKAYDDAIEAFEDLSNTYAGAMEQREQYIEWLMEEARAGKISPEHAEEMMEAAIEDVERQKIVWDRIINPTVRSYLEKWDLQRKSEPNPTGETESIHPCRCRSPNRPQRRTAWATIPDRQKAEGIRYDLAQRCGL